MTEQIRALLIDDEPVFLESLTKVLVHRGMSVQGAHDGYKALEILDSEEFDVIVLDMRMPGMDGLATLKAIRNRDALTPVLLLTGHFDLDQVLQAMKGGVGEVFLKPSPVEHLVSAIVNAYERKDFARQAASNWRNAARPQPQDVIPAEAHEDRLDSMEISIS